MTFPNSYKQSGYMISGYVTPDSKLSDGFDSTGQFAPAPFLPVLRFNQEQEIPVVISSGTPVAFLDEWLVPAGYKLELEAVESGAPATIFYTQLDVMHGVKNYAGQPVTVGEAVATSILAANKDVSFFVGIVNKDAFQYQGSDFNPAEYRHINFNPQPGVTFNMDYHYEYPLAATNQQVDSAPLTGIAAFVGTSVKPGQFVTYNKQSRFVTTAADFTYGTVAKEAILGQVSKVLTYRDPNTLATIRAVNSLDQVVAPMNFTGNRLNDLPSIRNGGIPQKLTYANAYGVVRFGLQTR